MNRIKQLTSLALCVLLTSGCATIVRGPSQSLPVTSDPSGAVVDLRCAGAEPRAAVTPATFHIPRKATECTVSVSAAGHHPAELALERQRSGLLWANFAPAAVYGSLVLAVVALLWPMGWSPELELDSVDLALVALTGGGMLIDRGTGAMYKQAPDRIDVTLTPLDESADLPPEGATGIPTPGMDP
jgi:hypothetical protein